MNIDHIDEADPVMDFYSPTVRKWLEYRFPMDDLSLSKVILPYDITRHEADRLMRIIDTLPLPT